MRNTTGSGRRRSSQARECTLHGRQGRRPDSDGAAIAALICAFFVPILGIIFGHVSRGQAKRAGKEPSGVATARCVLGTRSPRSGILIIVLIAAAANAANNPYPLPSYSF
jgi:hypothetical protein